MFGCVLLYLPLCVPLASGRVFSYEDLVWFHLPMRFLYHRALHSGQSFLWTPELHSGLFLHAEGQVGMMHPLHLALYRTLPLWIAFNVELLTTYAAGLGGMWWFLRRLQLRPAACLVGAMSFAFCGFNLMHLNHMNSIAVAMHIPWLLWSADVLLVDDRARRRAIGFAVFAASLGSALLLGFPQYVWMSGLAVAWWIVVRLWSGAPPRRVVLLAAGGVLGILAGAAQLLPTLESVRTSIRVGTPMAFRLTFSLHPLNVIQLWSPYAFPRRVYAELLEDELFPHEFALYTGALATMSIAWVALRWRDARPRLIATAFLVLAAAGLVLSFGGYGGVYPLLARLPGVSGFRAPARHILLLHFALAGLVAMVIDDLGTLSARALTLPWRRLWPLAIPLGCSVAVPLIAAFGGIRIGDRSVLSGQARLMTGVALMAVTVLLTALAARGWRAALPLLIVFSAADLAAWGLRYVWLGPPVTIASVQESVPVPPRAVAGDYVSPIYSPDVVNLFPLRGMRSTIAYVGLPGARTLNPADLLTRRLAGARWASQGGRWHAVPDPMPRSRLVSDVRVDANPAAALAMLDISRTAVVDRQLEEQVSGAPGVASLLVDDPGRLVIQTSAPAPQLLVTTERFHPGWRAVAEGHSLDARVVNAEFLGCVVPPGTHRVTFVFDPSSVRIGVLMSAAGLIAVAAAALAIARGGESPRAARPSGEKPS